MKAKVISFVVAETSKPKKGKMEAPVPGKSAPHYFEETVPKQYIISEEKIQIDGRDGILELKTYQPNILLAEAVVELYDIFGDEVFGIKERMIEQCHDILKKRGGKNSERFSEEYTVYTISDYKGDPEQFLENKEKIATLLKSEKLALDPSEIDYTLSLQLKYAKNDLAIVDWDGAFVFDPEGDYQSTIELLELANMQLLRFRLLDQQLDERLHRVAKLIEEAPRERRSIFKATEVSKALREAMFVRSISVSEFQDLERDIKLIGDWYSARLYDLVSKKFKLDEWRHAVKDKLDAIESVYAIASENFTITWEQRSKIIEMVGWYILLFGWLILLILDFYFYKK